MTFAAWMQRLEERTGMPIGMLARYLGLLLALIAVVVTILELSAR